MKSQVLAFVFGATLAGAGVWIWTRHGGEEEGNKEEEHHEEHRVEHTPDGRVILTLESGIQEKIGLKSEPLAAAELAPQVRAVGRVLDPEPLAALVSEIATARVAVDSSGREFERLKMLNVAGQNASARALETAEAEARKNRLTLEALERRLIGAWGTAIAGRADLAQLANDLAARKAALVRLDVSLGDAVSATFAKASVLAPGNHENPVDVSLLGPTPDTDPVLRGPGYFTLWSGNPPPVGSVLTGWLSDGSKPVAGVIVPRAAVVRHQGRMFAYFEIEGGRLERREMLGAHPTPAGWFVSGGPPPGANAIIQGAGQLLSEELKSSFGEEP